MRKRLSRRNRYRPTAVDLYSGSGAVTTALKRRSFRVVAAIDNDPVACATYRLNHPATRMIEKDIREVKPVEIRRRDLRGRDLDLLIVCAPCQPFSRQNRKRGEDKRSELILQAGRFAKALRPQLIFFENVPGLASPRHSALIEKLRKQLGKDYVLSEPMQIDAADFEVPQRRIRCIMLATRKCEPPKLPKPLTPKGRRITVHQAICKMRPLKCGEVDARDPLHAARNHLPIALRRLAAVPKDGGSRSSLPAALELACHLNVGKSKFSDVYGRMKWKDVAPTLTTGCTDITRGRFAHPEQNRAITLREASLLQTFPKRYRFTGTGCDIQIQIGNAVPVKFIGALVPMFRKAIRERRR